MSYMGRDELANPIVRYWATRQNKNQKKIVGKTIAVIFYPDDEMVIVFADKTYAVWETEGWGDDQCVEWCSGDWPLSLSELRLSGLITEAEKEAEDARLKKEALQRSRVKTAKQQRNKEQRDRSEYKRLKKKFGGADHE